jgi:hypothetical protein
MLCRLSTPLEPKFQPQVIILFDSSFIARFFFPFNLVPLDSRAEENLGSSDYFATITVVKTTTVMSLCNQLLLTGGGGR